MPQPRKRQTGAAKEEASSLPPIKSDRSVTVHPRVSQEENQIVKSMAGQLRLPEMAIWGNSASDGLIITLIKKGPDEMGIYGGRWTAKELAQIARRRILNTLIDFQSEQDELPALLRDYIETLKTLAEKPPQGIIVAGNMPMTQPEEPTTEEDALVFSQAGNAGDVTESLGGMGFGILGLNPPEDGS